MATGSDVKIFKLATEMLCELDEITTKAYRGILLTARDGVSTNLDTMLEYYRINSYMCTFGI